MPTTQIMKPLQLFVPITRSMRTDDGACLLVEGYAYCNAVVGDGWNLKRTAMEAATPDYLAWGAIREMHQPSAAGTATGTVTVGGVEIPLGVEWDDKGAFIRTKIVDDQAIKKCEQGVYKGFSIGVQPTKVRGADVEACAWFENSLVDRPADKDANFTRMLIARRDDAPEDGTDIEVEVYEPDETLPGEGKPEDADTDAFVVRGLFQTKVSARENDSLRGLAWDVLRSVLWDVLNRSSVTDVEQTTREAITEFADYVVPLIVAERAKKETADSELPDEFYYAAGIDEDALVTRMGQITRAELDGRGELTRVMAERDANIARVAELTGQVSQKDAEIERLKKLPDLKQARPVRSHGAALERTFAQTLAETQNGTEPDAVRELRGELARLATELPKETDEKTRQDGIARMLSIKQTLASGGHLLIDPV